jgi:hypothetical protein
VVIGFLSVVQDKAQRLRLYANQPWAAQRLHAAHFHLGSFSSTPLPVLIGYLSNDNHCCYCLGVGLLKEFNRAPTSPPLLVRSAGCEAEGRKTEHQMEYRTLALSCECGGVPKNISAVGLSSEHGGELVIHWRCPRCRRNVCTVKPLSDCWRECFTPASANLPNAKPTVDTAYDRRFLHRIGIRYSDE